MSSEEKLICVFCKEFFDDKETLQIHFRKHADPTFNKPNNNKSPKNEPELSKEKSNAKEVDVVSCDVCTEVFPTISKAITHKHKVHPDHDTKYFCEWCGKLFTMKHLYNKHVVIHDSMEKTGDDVIHCDCCNVDFYVPSAMIYHNKFFHRQDMELPAIGHSKKQKFVNQELMPIYYCAFCGEEYINKVNLHKHMADDHGDENQSPEEVLRCPLCEAIFYHLDAYELHLTFHAVGDIYKDKEMNDDLTEFTLESVSPILEKVENCEEESDAMDVEQLLQMTIQGNNKQKHKKHKKHKKSKKEKAAITLDEFLNMNTDVFGEDLNVQGVEEVPSKAVTKRLQSKPQQSLVGKKFVTPKELEKLKQQGIVVKMKSNLSKAGTVAPGTKILTGKPVNIIKEAVPSQSKQLLMGTQIKTTIDKNMSSEEILSKLINQNQSQIKIIKKPPEASVSDNSSKQNITNETKTVTPEHIEVECDLLPRDSDPSSELDAEDNINNSKIKSSTEFTESLLKTETTKINETLNDNQKTKTVTALVKLNNGEKNLHINYPEVTTCNNLRNEKDLAKEPSIKVGENDQTISHSLDLLRNIGQQLTIKSVKQRGEIGETEIEENVDKNSESCVESKEVQKLNDFDNKVECEKINLHSPKRNIHFPKLNKSQNTVKDDIQSEDHEETYVDDQVPVEENLSPTDDSVEIAENKNRLNVLRSLGISVKSNNKEVHDEIDGTPKEAESCKPETGNTLSLLKSLGITIKSNSQIASTNNTYTNNFEAKIGDKTSKTETDRNTHGLEARSKTSEETEKSSNVLRKVGVNFTPKKNETKNEMNKYGEDEHITDNETIPMDKTVQTKDKSKIKGCSSGQSLNALKKLGITIKSTKLCDDIRDENQEVFEDEQYCDSNGAQLDRKSQETEESSNVLTKVGVNINSKKNEGMIEISKYVEDEDITDNETVSMEKTIQSKDKLKIKGCSSGQSLNALKKLGITIKSTKCDDIRDENQQVFEDEQACDSNNAQLNRKSSTVTQELSVINSSNKSSTLNSIKQSQTTVSSILKQDDEDFDSEIDDLHENLIQNKKVFPKLPEGITIKTPSHSPKADGTKPLSKTCNTVNKKILNYPMKSSSKIFQNFGQGIKIQSSLNKILLNSNNPEESEIYNVDDSDEEEDSQCFERTNEAISNSIFQKAIPSNISSTIKDSKTGTLLQKNIKNENSTDDYFDEEIEHNLKQNIKGKATSSVSKLINNKNLSLKSLQGTATTDTSNKYVPKVHNKNFVQRDNEQIKTINSFDDFLSNESSDDEYIHLKQKDFHNINNEQSLVPLEKPNPDNQDYETDDSMDDNQFVINKLKNYNQNLTIKSNKSNNVNKTESEHSAKSVIKNKSNMGKRVSSEVNPNSPQSKLFKTTEDTSDSETTAKTYVNEIGGRSLNQSIGMNQQLKTATNQEVTRSVKTIQTKTVVQEITTTVTRTIKTVNQEISTNNQTILSNAAVLNAPKIVQGMKIINPQIKNFQGTAVRQSTPVHRPRTRPMAPLRHTTNTAVRTPNQNTFIGIKQIRPVGQRMPIMKTVQSNPRSIHPGGGQVKTQLRFAPTVVKQQMPNPTTPETEGHFSCFKKPKESLIPGSQDSIVNVASSSHVSKSNFSSYSKTVKGNTVVAAKEMKSEVNVSSQHMNKFNSAAGLTVMKVESVRQSKEVVKEMDKCVMTNHKRTTQDAIEKLQRLGLHVKKPRIEPEDSENSDFDGDDHVGEQLAIESGG